MIASSPDWPPLCSCGEQISSKTQNKGRLKVQAGTPRPGWRRLKAKKTRWRAVSAMEISFLFYKFPWRHKTSPEVDIMVMERAFNEFEELNKIAEFQDQEIDDTHCGDKEATNEDGDVSKMIDQGSAIVTDQALPGRDIPSNKDIAEGPLSYLEECDIFEGEDDYEELESYFSHIANLSVLPPGARLRRKHKWRREKAHKAVKTKYCRSENITNRPHGRKLFINQRIHKQMFRDTSRALHFLPKPPARNSCSRPIGKESQAYQPIAKPVHYPRAPRPPAHALNANNADRGLPVDLVRVLVNLQHREVTPEDYEILLQLDDSVGPRTVDLDLLERFRTDHVTAGDAEILQACAVCLEAYSVGQLRKFLPCGHNFHGGCIDTWLTNASLNCPLDGLPVDTL